MLRDVRPPMRISALSSSALTSWPRSISLSRVRLGLVATVVWGTPFVARAVLILACQPLILETRYDYSTMTFSYEVAGNFGLMPFTLSRRASESVG